MRRLFGEKAVNELLQSVQKSQTSQYFSVTEKHLAITHSGLLFADRMIAELMK